MKNKGLGGLVYTTEHGRMCPGCGQPLADCRCAEQAAAPAGDGIVRVRRETKGRKGKGVTTVSGVPLAAAELAAYAKTLRQQCGSGGTVKDGVIEIQGDHVETVMAALAKTGWTVKRAGG